MLFPKLTTLFLTCLLCSALPDASAQQSSAIAKYQWVRGNDYCQSKNWYLLSLFATLPDVQVFINQDPVLQELAANKRTELQQSLSLCNREAFCYTEKLKFSEQAITAIAARLAALYTTGNALGHLVSQHLKPSGAYIQYDSLEQKTMLVKAWEQDARSINHTIAVYAEGQKANYPLIDSTSFDVTNKNYAGLVYNFTSVLLAETQENQGFFSIPFAAAFQLLEMNERTQAGDFEPMTAGENKAAADRVKITDFNKYPYSVILVPGAGPDDPGVALSAEAMLRCRLAAVHYAKHEAPFIILSGGKVHPYKTKFCEATEMKKYMIEKLHVLAAAIIIEPHARHTTTNMRNAARLMFRYGFPFAKPGITVTTRFQSTMIETTLLARCLKELGYAPYRNGKRLDETCAEFFPFINSLQLNGLEPMDP